MLADVVENRKSLIYIKIDLFSFYTNFVASLPLEGNFCGQIYILRKILYQTWYFQIKIKIDDTYLTLKIRKGSHFEF